MWHRQRLIVAVSLLADWRGIWGVDDEKHHSLPFTNLENTAKEMLQTLGLRSLCVCVCMCVCVWNPLFHAEQFCVTNLAGALSTPWQTQCNEAMPWSGKRGLINLVYLHFRDIWMVNFWLPVLLIQAVASQCSCELAIWIVQTCWPSVPVQSLYGVSFTSFQTCYSGLSMMYLGLLKAFLNINTFFSFNLSYLQCVWVLDLTWSHRRLLSRRPRVGAGHLPYRLKATL